MSESDTTLEKLSDREILLKLVKKFDRLENEFGRFRQETGNQFEAIRQEIAANSAAFDRLEAAVYSSRSDVANLRASVKELTEEVRQMKKEPVI